MFLDFLRTLIRKKRWIFLATAIPTIASIVIVLLGESIYKSEALVNPPESDGGGMDALRDLSSGSMGSLLGSLGGGETGYNDCISILQSTRFAQLMINRFDLETAYQFKKEGSDKKYYQADVVKTFRRRAAFETTEEDAIKISMKDTSALRAQHMVAHMIHLLDSLYTDIQKAATAQRLAYIDERLTVAEVEMRRLEDSLVIFKNRHNLLAPDAQIRMILQNATQTELRLETIKEEQELEAALRGTLSARYEDLKVQRRLLEKTLADQMRSRVDTNSLILPTHTLPALATEYFRHERAYVVRLGVYKFLVQQAEMLRFEADKNIRVISVVDPPWLNDKRVSPKRRIVVQSVFVISLLLSIFLVILHEAWRRHCEKNPESVLMASEIRRNLLKP
jgi:uncharacterized protein involved in exopolysaccharide biosynthesis